MKESLEGDEERDKGQVYETTTSFNRNLGVYRGYFMMNEKERDPNRIKRILHLLQVIWKLNPNMRFFQLIDSLQHEYSNENNEFGKRKGIEIDFEGYRPMTYIDLFYLEDERLEGFLREFIEKKEGRR